MLGKQGEQLIPDITSLAHNICISIIAAATHSPIYIKTAAKAEMHIEILLHRGRGFTLILLPLI